MARWQLKEKHTLNVKGIEWEQVETVQETGEQLRHRFAVPLYLDPDDSGILKRWGQGGALIVSDGVNSQSRDIVFVGPPTPAMEPLDDEAQAITNAERPKWTHPIESLPGQGFGDALLIQFTKQLAEVMNNRPVAPQPVAGVSIEDFVELQKQVGALMARNAELESAKVERRA